MCPHECACARMSIVHVTISCIARTVIALSIYEGTNINVGKPSNPLCYVASLHEWKTSHVANGWFLRMPEKSTHSKSCREDDSSAVSIQGNAVTSPPSHAKTHDAIRLRQRKNLWHRVLPRSDEDIVTISCTARTVIVWSIYKETNISVGKAVQSLHYVARPVSRNGRQVMLQMAGFQECQTEEMQ